MLNVIFQIATDGQLQYTCKNGKSIFENMTTLLNLALTNASKEQDKNTKAMTQVKSYIISYLLPKAINRSLKFLTPKLTLIYLQVINKAMEIEVHLRDLLEIKVKHF